MTATNIKDLVKNLFKVNLLIQSGPFLSHVSGRFWFKSTAISKSNSHIVSS